jgi:hypothetical protein
VSTGPLTTGIYIEETSNQNEWGNVRVYFDLELNGSGRIVRLDIGKGRGCRLNCPLRH